MFNADLREFIDRVMKSGRMTAADVKHLRAHMLEDGIGTRQEADALLALDGIADADPSWAEFLTAIMVDYVVWSLRPTGRVSAGTAAWLVTAFTRAGSTGTGVRIARAIAAEAEEVDAELLLFAHGGAPTFDSLAA